MTSLNFLTLTSYSSHREKIKSGKANVVLDLREESCPEPQIEVAKVLKKMKEGEILEVIVDREPVNVSISYIYEGKEYPCEIKKDSSSYKVRILKTH
ncbi:MAG: sulfurtransferase TusA family protein [Sulfolobus sp.]|nr:sulfurtransferase TusA family protein [Sulfolobus sp.]